MRQQLQSIIPDSMKRNFILSMLFVSIMGCFLFAETVEEVPTASTSGIIIQLETVAIPESTPTTTMTCSDTPTSQIEPTKTIQTNVWLNCCLGNIFVTALIVYPDTQVIIAGTQDGVYKSIQGGGDWVEMNSGFPGGYDIPWVWSLAIDPITPTTVYAGTDIGVYKKIEGVDYWVLMNNGIPNHYFINSLAIDPKTPTTIYAGATFYSGGGSDSDGIVLKSTDGGVKWREITSTIYDNVAFDLAINPSAPETVYVGMRGGVMKSKNGGVDWSLINTGLDNKYVLSVDVSPDPPNAVYAGTDGGVYVSTNDGMSWDPLNTGLINTRIVSFAFDPANSAILYVGTDGGGVYKSEDGGVNWIAVGTGLGRKTLIYSLAVNPSDPSIVYAGTDDGLFVLHQSPGV
jgi:hypothetical protein